MPYFGNTGWICPKCGRTYSPMTPSCFICGQPTKVTTDAVSPNKLYDIFSEKAINSWREVTVEQGRETEKDADV